MHGAYLQKDCEGGRVEVPVNKDGINTYLYSARDVGRPYF